MAREKDPSDAYKEDRYFRDEEERAYQLAKMKNCLPIKDAPKDGRYLLLVDSNGKRVVAATWSAYSDPTGETGAEIACWRDSSYYAVGPDFDYFMFLPWEYNNDDIDAIVLEVLKAVMADNENLPIAKFITAGPMLIRLISLVFGLTRTVVNKPSSGLCVECPDCAAVVSIELAPKGSTFEDTAICPACGKVSYVENFKLVMPLPNQNQAPQQARAKEGITLDELKDLFESTMQQVTTAGNLKPYDFTRLPIGEGSTMYLDPITQAAWAGFAVGYKIQEP